jgi:AcrR family transcriptional regulator
MLSTFPEEKLDPRVKRTRQLLEQAFSEVISEKGLQGISVQDITDRAGVNRATFYAHFEDKYALLDYTIRQGFRQEVEKRMLSVCNFSMDNLRNLIIAVGEYLLNVNSQCKPANPQFELLVENQVRGQLQEILLKWTEQNECEVSAKTAATAASWSLYGLALQWSHEKKRVPVEQFADDVLPLIAWNLKLKEPAV